MENKIYLEAYKNNKPESHWDLLEAIFSVQTNLRWRRGCATYSDPQCLIQQCDMGRRRSFDDLYAIFTTYFEDITESELFHLICNSRIADHNPAISYCPDIQRPVIQYYGDRFSRYWQDSGSFKHKVNSKYSIEELFNLTYGDFNFAQFKERFPKLILF